MSCGDMHWSISMNIMKGGYHVRVMKGVKMDRSMSMNIRKDDTMQYMVRPCKYELGKGMIPCSIW